MTSDPRLSTRSTLASICGLCGLLGFTLPAACGPAPTPPVAPAAAPTADAAASAGNPAAAPVEAPAASGELEKLAEKPPEKPPEKVLQVGFAPFRDPDELEDHVGWFLKALSDAVDTPVEMVVGSSYQDTIDMVVNSEVHVAVLPPRAYVLAHDRQPKLEIVARVVNEIGAYYHSQLIVAATSPIQTLAELKGQKICYVDQRSTSGYLFPRVMLRKAGLDPDTHLSGKMFAGTHPQAVEKLLAGECAVAAVADTEAAIYFRMQKVDPARVRVIATSDSIPMDSIVISPGAEPDVAAGVRAVCAKLIADYAAGERPDRTFLVGLVAGTDADYDPIREAAKERQ